MSLLYNFLNTTYSYFSPPPVSPQSLPVSREPPLSAASPLKERLDAACQSPTSSIAHMSSASMRRELDLTKHDLARAHVDTTRLEERCKMLEKTLKETRELLRSREAELEKVRRERDRERAMNERRRSDGLQYGHHAQDSSGGSYSRSLDTRLSSSDLARRMYNDRMREARRTPSPSHTTSTTHSAQNTNGHSTPNGRNTPNGHSIPAITLNDEDRARQRSAETYMTRTDSWSGAQVLQAVHDINSEILQFAASATETCNFLPAAALSSNPKLTQVIQDTNARIGPNITRILANREHSQDPLLVQLALQGCVSLCIARALNGFCIGFPSKSDAVLAQIHGHMQMTEPQPTAAKWRALAHSHIHSIYPTLTDYSVNELSETILRWCADIFVIANGHTFSPSSPVQSPSSSPPISFSPPSTSTIPQTPAAQLRMIYLDQIKRISRAVMRLASVIREEIMSTSFELSIADPSGSFEDGEMVDAFGNYAESHGQVLVTMELGLRCVTRIAVEMTMSDEQRDNVTGTSGRDGVLESRLLLPPKVVLESVLEVLDR
ncbi:hypothetical protein CPB84DRAFT_1764055 [Gymnopilus junonius]|uniref:Uncharacterized protein n=1 Tax=Gymnopilus junonius TaxID=109634 RepID=A0A9P5NW36_GYMJU|nr:hypothetical protein CPB84DRAFT_1764055 [Gymnopilus junonius]